MLKQLGVERVDVFGVSWGGALAQEFAPRHPSMVRRLILAATSSGAELHVQQGEGHFFVVTSAKRTAEAIYKFLYQQHDGEESSPMMDKGTARSRTL